MKIMSFLLGRKITLKRAISILSVVILISACLSFSVFAENNKPTTLHTAVINDDFGVIYGLEEGLTKNRLLNYYLSVADSTEVVCNDLLGTGDTVAFINESTGQTVYTYTILIIGDSNGDGFCDGEDSVIADCIYNDCLGENDLGRLRYIAADANQDGSVDDADVELLKNSGLLLTEINQTYLFYGSNETYSVTFKDYDGAVLSTVNNVVAGGNALPPASPSKPGASFLGWSGNYTNVISNETVTAVYSDEKNVFLMSSESGSVGDTVTVLLSVDGSVNICGFDLTVLYDENLELVSFDEDLDLDVVANPNRIENGIILNSSSNSNKTKQRDIIEMTFRIKDTSKKALPINISMTSAKEVSGSLINDTSYKIVNGVVYVNG